MLNDEYMEYDELDDVVQYHKYYLLMDNNHIYKFLILEPNRKIQIRIRDDEKVPLMSYEID